jgi:hypothetical protein
MVFDSLNFNDPAADRQRAISRQFRAPEAMRKAIEAGEQPEVVKELTHRPQAGFTEEQVLLMFLKTVERVTESYGIKV